MFTTIFKGTAAEFRYRIVIHFALFFLAFAAPWNRLLGFSDHIVWSAVGFQAMRAGVADFGVVTETLTVVAVLCAVLGAALRVWGTAYMSKSVVQDSAMHIGANAVMVADGPYRRVRNPLYLGTILLTFALTLIMTVSGAIFAVVTIVFFNLRLIGGEETFLSAKLGGPYLEYKKRVPRLLPSLRAKVPASGAKPNWGQALYGEIYFVAIAVVYATLAWQFNAHLLGRYLIVALGGWMVLRAFRKDGAVRD